MAGMNEDWGGLAAAKAVWDFTTGDARRFLELKQEALNLLHEEAVRAFDAGATGPFDLVEAYGRRSRGGSPPVK